VPADCLVEEVQLELAEEVVHVVVQLAELVVA
jgi:hypothetical protein